MKRALVLLFLVLSTVARATGPDDPAPSFALPTADNGTIALTQLRGHIVYVDFWASWCGPCRRSFPWMNRMQERYGKQGLMIIGINVDKKRGDAQRFLDQFPAQFTVAYDAPGATPEAYAIKGMPSSFLIDTGGRVVMAEQGFSDEQAATLEARIRSLLSK
jgi:cytochrome c biogenesis protein CcmG/thiol:disulfide interchange protein DsbE